MLRNSVGILDILELYHQKFSVGVALVLQWDGVSGLAPFDWPLVMSTRIDHLSSLGMGEMNRKRLV